MKYKIIFLLIFSFFSMKSQTMFTYEKEINKIEGYTVEQIITSTSDTAVTLVGTLITPKTDFDKIIVTVPGSGNISQHVYNYLSENLLENNIGVYRYDRRGIGKSGGSISGNIINYSEDLLEPADHHARQLALFVYGTL